MERKRSDRESLCGIRTTICCDFVFLCFNTEYEYQVGPTNEMIGIRNTSKRQRVAIFGAGIAGLTCAWTLSRLGYQVDVYEAEAIPGGMARSSRTPSSGVPTEYSWRGFAGGWYKNIFNILQDLPSVWVPGTSLYQSDLVPVSFWSMRDSLQMSHLSACSSASATTPTPTLLTWLTPHDWWVFVRELLRVSSSEGMERARWAETNFADYFRPMLSEQGGKNLIATAGPWVGVDPQRMSVYCGLNFFRMNIFFDGKPHIHDERLLWRVMKGPTTENWFNPWVKRMAEEFGVHFHFDCRLERLQTSNPSLATSTCPTVANATGKTDSAQEMIAFAQVYCKTTGRTVRVFADHYVCAIGPYAMQQVLCDSQSLELLQDPALALFRVITQEEPHVQVSFRLGFVDDIRWPLDVAVIFTDSEFNITMYAVQNEFHPTVFLGDNIRTLWSGTACVADVPGRLFHRAIRELTRKEFQEEILWQIYRSEDFQLLIAQNNQGQSLNSFGRPVVFEIWQDWEFRGDLERDEKDTSSAVGSPAPGRGNGEQANLVSEFTSRVPKWVLSTRNANYLPPPLTSFPNLVLAGAHVQTVVDLYSMEAAAESGQRAALLISGLPGSSDPGAINYLHLHTKPHWMSWWGNLRSPSD